MTRLAPLLLVLALLGACGEPTAVLRPITLGEPFVLAPGEGVVLPGNELGVGFQQVLEDSRCPEDALILCLWAGRVRLRMVTTPPALNDQGFFEIHLGDEPTLVLLGDLQVELLEVLPAARIGTIPTREYRARFVVTRVTVLPAGS